MSRTILRKVAEDEPRGKKLIMSANQVTVKVVAEILAFGTADTVHRQTSQQMQVVRAVGQMMAFDKAIGQTEAAVAIHPLCESGPDTCSNERRREDPLWHPQGRHYLRL